MQLVVVTTIITPATPAFDGQAAYDLVDIATVKDELGITDTLRDKSLFRWITQASAAAAKFCNRVFPVQTYQDQFFPPRDYFPAPTVIGGLDPLQLTRWPLTPATLPAIPGDLTVTENDIALTAGTDFLIKDDVGQLIRLNINGWPKRWPALPIVAEYAAGYDLTDPQFADLVDGVLRMIKGRYYAQERDPALKSENIVGAYEATYALTGSLSPETQELLTKYRVPVFG